MSNASTLTVNTLSLRNNNPETLSNFIPQLLTEGIVQSNLVKIAFLVKITCAHHEERVVGGPTNNCCKES
jgi:hypothetical protein